MPAIKPPIQARNTPISFYLGSGSKVKVAALTNALHSQNIHGYCYPIPQARSGVSEQPFGDAEILRGAINRALSAYNERPDGEVYVSMENGIKKVNQDYYVDYAVVLAFVPSYGSIQYVQTAEVRIDAEYVYRTQEKSGGFFKNTVGKTLQEAGVVRFHDDPHLDLSGISRRDILRDAMVQLFDRLPQGIFLRNPKSAE